MNGAECWKVDIGVKWDLLTMTSLVTLSTEGHALADERKMQTTLHSLMKKNKGDCPVCP